MRSLISIFLICFCSLQGHSQNQAKQWYFGYGCGLDFHTDPPTALLDNEILTAEGCATISNENGELLFYTNGVTVMSKDHEVMENGSNLHGHQSTTQSAIIVPWPLDDQLYFIFTIGAQLSHGLKYSVVDMSMNNGQGAVIEKNVHLLDRATEKQTVISHANGRDFWLISHPFRSDEYHSFLITCDGVEKQAVISAVGSAMEENTGCCETSSAIGCLKASPNGKMIASTWSAIYDVVDSWAVSTWHLELLDFDNETGRLSNAREITQNFNQGLYLSYGVCFSPDNTKLYQSTGEETLPRYGIYQYDLLAEDISSSQDRVTIGNIAFGTIEIGPDKKLYAARLNGMTSLTTIENPNDLNPQIGSVDLGGRVSTWGLPNLIYDYQTEVFSDPFLVSDTTVCSSSSLFLDVTKENAWSYLWNDGSTEPQRNITKAGLYYVDVETEKCGFQRDSIYVDFSYSECSDESYCDLVQVSPNPFYYDVDLNEDFEITLYDAAGKLVFQGKKSSYSFEALPSGMYFLAVANCESVLKIIKLL